MECGHPTARRRLDGALRDAERGGDLPLGQPRPVAQDEHFTLPPRQVADGGECSSVLVVVKDQPPPVTLIFVGDRSNVSPTDAWPVTTTRSWPAPPLNWMLRVFVRSPL